MFQYPSNIPESILRPTSLTVVWLALAMSLVPSGVAAGTEQAKPPIQVRRVLDVVVPTAESVARSVAIERGDRIADGEVAPSATPDVPEDSATAETVLASSRRPSSERSGSEESPSHELSAADQSSSSWGEWTQQWWSISAWTEGSDDVPGDATGKLTADPYVEDPRWGRAMRLLKEGDCKKSLDLVDEVISQSERDLKSIRGVEYAVARIKMCTPGYRKQGRQTMRQIAGGDDVTAELARRRLGWGRSPTSRYLKKPDQPEEGSARALPSYVLNESRVDATRSAPTTNEVIREARDLARDGDVDDAVSRLQKHRSRLEDAWSRYRTYEVQASILWRAGRQTDAGRAFRGAYHLADSWDRGSELESRIDRLESRSGMKILTLGDRVDRMRELIRDGEYYLAKQVSIDNADRAGVKGREIEGWSLYRQGLEAEQRRDRREAIELFRKAEARVESDVIRPRLYYGWARALRRVGDDPEAVGMYERLCDEYPAHHLCDDARYQAGRLSMYDNHFEEAREFFADVVGLHPESPHHADALWLGGFSAYLAEKYAAARKPLEVLQQRYGDQLDSSGTSLALKAKYWQAVASLKLGEKDRAEQRLQGVINDNPLSWYGRLAAARLEQLGVAPVVPLPPAEMTHRELTDLGSLGLPDHPKYQVAKEYAKIELYADAARDIERQLRVAPSPPGARHLLATLWMLSGDIHRSHWMMNDYLSPEGPTLFDMRTWGLAYPVEFLEESHRWGREYDVDPLLIQSVIRQESGFRPAVDSYAGAVGLMQLMPGTANYASNEWFDGSWVSRSDLQTPDINIRYGSAYLRVMLAHTNANVPMALAGYNAGPAPMRRWFKDYGAREVDAWVESLTYEQARGYVRKVYTNYVRYTALYAGSSRELPTPSLSLPGELAPWGKVLDARSEPKKISLKLSQVY